MAQGLATLNQSPAGDGSPHEQSPQIGAAPRPCCPFCSRVGEILYTGLVDWLNGVPQSWGTRRCVACRLAWLDPQPIAKDIPRLYASYYTHNADQSLTYMGRLQQEACKCVLARLGYPVVGPKEIAPRLFSHLRFAKRLAVLSVLDLPASGAGSLLDVGCGNGELIARMRSLGWNASGIDVDPAAVTYAQSQGLDVRMGTITDLDPSTRYDVIVLSHVIEHVSDPVELLRACAKRLRPIGGQLIVLTPNIDSLGHAWFKRYWRGLEVPRHFMVFSPAALRECAARAGLAVRSMTTEVRSAQMIYKQSTSAKKGEIEVAGRSEVKIGTKVAARLFRVIEDWILLVRGDVGEEIFCVCTKSAG